MEGNITPIHERITNLERAVRKLKHRNQKVEAEKAWETSKTRIVSLTITTYFVALIFMLVINISNPFSNALIPTTGFFISTQSIPIIKKLWFKYSFTQ